MIDTTKARACVGFAHSDAPRSLLLWPGWRLSHPRRERRLRPPAMPGDDELVVVRKAESAKVPSLFLGVEGWLPGVAVARQLGSTLATFRCGERAPAQAHGKLSVLVPLGGRDPAEWLSKAHQSDLSSAPSGPLRRRNCQSTVPL